MSEMPNHFLEMADQCTQLLPVLIGKSGERLRQRFHPAPPAFLENPSTFRGCFEPHATPVFCFSTAHQAGTHQARDDATHGGRADVLRLRELAQRPRAASQHEH